MGQGNSVGAAENVAARAGLGHVSVLLERERETAALTVALGSAQRGSGTVTVIEGAAGIGKSQLLALAAERAHDDDFEVLRARGLELEQDAPLGTVAQLFVPRLASASPAELEQLLAGQARLTRFLTEPGLPPPPDHHALIRGLYWLTANLSTRADGERVPVAIIVDDVQWADRPSLAFLAHLAMRVDELPVMIALAVRSDELGKAAEILGPARITFSSPVLTPRPLSEAAVGKLVSLELPEPEPEFVAACARITGGNPFLTRELARELRADGVSPTAASVARVAQLVPASVLHSVLARLGRVADSGQRLARALAVLGDGAPLRRAALLGEVEFASAEEGADALARAAILEPGEPLRFAHPLIASAVRSDLPAFARARGHREAAELLERDGATDQEIATHLMLSTPSGDQWAVGILRSAARSALRRGDPVAASRLLERALAEPPPAAQRTDVLLELAETLALKGDTAAEEHALRALDQLNGGDSRIRALQTLSRIRLLTGDHQAAADALREVLAAADPGTATGLRTLSEYLTLTTFRAPLHPAAKRALAPILAAARKGSPPRDPGLSAHVALRLALDDEPPETIRALAEAATVDEPLVELGTYGMPMGILVQALCAVDELDMAEGLSDAGLRSAYQQGSLIAASVASYHRAISRYHRGALTAALGDLELALAPMREGWKAGFNWPLALRAHIEIDRGSLTAAEETLGETAPAPESMDVPIVLFARARHALATRAFDESFEHATRAGDLMLEGFGIDHPGLLPWREIAATAAASLGEREQARELAAQALSRARRCQTPRALAGALRVAATLDDGEQRVELLTEASAVLEHSPSKLAAAYTLADLGIALRRAGRRAEAQPPLRRALQLADGMGAAPLAESVRYELLATGARPRRAAYTGLDALTPAELRVAQLAAQGLTNPQIAQELFVTAKTVQTHLAHVYRKLDISSRQRLPAVLAQRS